MNFEISLTLRDVSNDVKQSNSAADAHIVQAALEYANNKKSNW